MTSSSIVTPITADILFGAMELEHTDAGLVPHRLPSKARSQCNDPQLLMAEAQPSGVRLAFRTEATTVELNVIPTKRDYIGMPPRPDGIYDLRVTGRLERQESVFGGRVLRINMATGAARLEQGEVQTLQFLDLPEGMKSLEIWLPHDEATELIALRSNAPIAPIEHDGKPVWLHHGSSISQGSNAASPTGTWPAVAADLAEAELVNLGFSGSALLDPFVARTIRDAPADFISLKLGINLVNTDLMRLRAFGSAVHGFLDTIREGHPNTPLVIISPIYCPIHETMPGPSQADLVALKKGRLLFQAAGNADEVKKGKLTLTVIRDHLRAIVEHRSKADDHIHYLDGRALYGEADNLRLPLPDELHPDAETHRLMGSRFADLVFGTGLFSHQGISKGGDESDRLK
ncbi:lipase [Rhizobium sp. P38BS-XIX]|uniref:SGNH/GDSL hydrolase family protein n=1 Tax=Rhizobium sp. P38BS-XIX TaxID=2726740 RepID=UPI0014573F31|nr:SGNH/GDSL hydrolase family protein [Rhizobium sp. P38BS-XIX]NLR97578.1 lipase [Rhizobium sp. P38BS-XIX]